jgi:hypothetical protein
MSWATAEFHFDDGTVLHGQLSSVGILLPYMYADAKANAEFKRKLELPWRCQCPGEECEVSIPCLGISWRGSGCRAHMLFLGPLDMADAEVENVGNSEPGG